MVLVLYIMNKLRTWLKMIISLFIHIKLVKLGGNRLGKPRIKI